MAKIIRNADFDEAVEIGGSNYPFFFDAEDGSDLVGCKTWLETSKKNDKHTDGKMWIKLPKNNVTNRQYFSLDLFDSTAVDGEVVVEVKTAAPRVLGSNGVRQDIIKYLDEDMAEEYTSLVTGATEKFKAMKAASKKKKLEDMTEEELVAYIEALKNGTTYAPTTSSAKSFIDCFDEDQYARYNEILAIAAENKANRPKVKRAPLTEQEKAIRKAKRQANELTKAEKLLELLRAGGFGDTDDDDDDEGHYEYNDEELDEE